MAPNQRMIDTLGLHLLAAELTRRGFLVAHTSRHTTGVDLFVADQNLTGAWTVQTRTNSKRRFSWLLHENIQQVQSDSHVYVFIKLNAAQRPDYYLVSSRQVAKDAADRERRTRTRWRSYPLKRAEDFRENWTVFGERRSEALLENKATAPARPVPTPCAA